MRKATAALDATGFVKAAEELAAMLEEAGLDPSTDAPGVAAMAWSCPERPSDHGRTSLAAVVQGTSPPIE